MRSKLFPVLLFLVVIMMAMPLMMRLSQSGRDASVELTSLDLGDGRQIRFTVEANSQQTLSLHYDATVNDEPQVEHAFFGTLPRTAPPPTFIVHASESGALVGIAQEAAPNLIIILHDFKTGQSWPMRNVTYKDTDPEHLYPYYEEADPIKDRGEALFVRLQEALPDQELDLLRILGTRPLTLPLVPEESAPDHQ